MEAKNKITQLIVNIHNSTKILLKKDDFMNKLFYLLFAAAIIIVSGTFAIYYIESEQEGTQINTMLDALWWTVATITTVGYGDIVPVSDAGRIIAIVYMFFGIGVIAIFLSVLGTNFYKKRFQEDEKEITHAQKLILEKIENQDKKIQEILDKLNK